MKNNDSNLSDSSYNGREDIYPILLKVHAHQTKDIKRIKSQNNKLSKWVEKQSSSNFISYEIQPH